MKTVLVALLFVLGCVSFVLFKDSNKKWHPVISGSKYEIVNNHVTVLIHIRGKNGQETPVGRVVFDWEATTPASSVIHEIGMISLEPPCLKIRAMDPEGNMAEVRLTESADGSLTATPGPNMKKRFEWVPLKGEY